MRFVAVGVLTLFLASLIFKNSRETYRDMSWRNFILHLADISSQKKEADKKTDEFLNQLKNKKEDLDYLREQINSLRTGLKESPDTDQNGYFKDLLTKFEDEEYALNQKIAQLDQVYQDRLRSLSPQEALQTSRLIEQNQANFQEQAQRMRDLMESNQMRAEAQMERLNDLMEQNQMYLEALIERTNALMEQRQNQPHDYMQTR
jgi:hypothetical protein